VSENKRAKAPASKLTRLVIGKNQSRNKTAKLKLSSWYEGSARSIGISKKRPPEKRNEAIE
jgi:hypothetical protein